MLSHCYAIMPGLPLLARETTNLGSNCSCSRDLHPMCRQDSRVPLSSEEAIAAEESLSIYCKPVELYNIIQRRALRNPSFLQRCLHYKIQARQKRRLLLSISLSQTLDDGTQLQNVFPLYVLLARLVSDAGVPEHSTVYRLSRACVLSAFSEFDRRDQNAAIFTIPELQKLSEDSKAHNLTILFVRHGETTNSSWENNAVKDIHDLASIPSKLVGYCLWGKLPMESLYISWKNCGSLSLGQSAEVLSTIDLHSGFVEPRILGKENYLIFRIQHNAGSMNSSKQVRVNVCVREVGTKDGSPYDSYTYDDVPSASLAHIIRLRTGNVIFNYRYYNNTLQKTEVTEDFSCPFCLVKCASFKGLRYHLTSSHDLFNFEFWVTEEYQAVNISVKTDIWRSEIIQNGVDPRLQTFFFCSKPRKRRILKHQLQNAKRVHPHAMKVDLHEAGKKGTQGCGLEKDADTNPLHMPTKASSKDARASNFGGQFGHFGGWNWVLATEEMRWERVQLNGRPRETAEGKKSPGRIGGILGPGRRWGHTCNSIKGGRFLYVFGGYGKDNCQTNDIHVFDTAKNAWSRPMVKGNPPIPRDSHSCTTVGNNLFVFGGTDGMKPLNDLYIFDTSSNTWITPSVSGEGPEAREGHSAALVGKRIFIFGGCGKSHYEPEEVYYNDVYILDTEYLVWKRAITTGTPPSARDSHTCSSWKNKIIIIGGEDASDYYLSTVHILDADTLVWRELNTSGHILTPRAGHSTVALGNNLFVFGGFTDDRNLYDDLHVLNVDTAVWSKVANAGVGPSARFSVAGDCLDPQKGILVFIGGCNQNLEALDDMYYLHTDMFVEIGQGEQVLEKFSFRRELKRKCQDQSLLPATRPENDKDFPKLMMMPNPYQPLPLQSFGQPGMQNFSSACELKPTGENMFEAKVTEAFHYGYAIETKIEGKRLRGILFSYKASFNPATDAYPSRKRISEEGGDVKSNDGDHSPKSKTARIIEQDIERSDRSQNDDVHSKESTSESNNSTHVDTCEPQMMIQHDVNKRNPV